MLEPGLQFNLSKNIGLSSFSPACWRNYKISNKDRLTYKQTGFGFHAVIRFNYLFPRKRVHTPCFL